jgi:hypothetical protein
MFGLLLVVLLPCADIVNGRAVVKKSNNLNGNYVKEIEVNMVCRPQSRGLVIPSSSRNASGRR